MAVDPFSEPISKLSDAVIYVARTTADFKSQLTQLKKTLETIAPIIADTETLNQKLPHTRFEQDMFVDEIHDAIKLVQKCLTIKWNFIKRFTHSLRLKDANQKLLRFFQIEVQAVQCRDIKKTLEEGNQVGERITGLALDVRQVLGQPLDKKEHVKCVTVSSERKELGWPVPPLPRGIVGFEEPLKELKERVVSDIDIHDDGSCGKVVVVSASGGCGKTTLVKMLANDPQIQDIFGENVFFVTVSETPNFMVSVNDLFNPNRFGHQVYKFQGIEDAKNKLENFLRDKLSGPILLVLDDVWQESYIKNFEFDIKGYRLLVTSRMLFPKYDLFKFDLLSDEHAKILFRNSSRPSPTIDETLVDQIVKCCKKHPLTLSVVGSSLDGKNEVVWKSMLRSLSQGHSIIDLNQEVLNRLERSFEALEIKFKQYFLDFGLFLEDERIPASALMDMWVHLYNHDNEGIDTLAKIYELSYRNLVNFMTKGEEENSPPLLNYCVEQFVTQHDLLRQLAINLNSKLPIAERPRLIISEQNDQLITNLQGEDEIKLVEQIQDPMQARILSISTGELFSSRWCNMRVSEVEVMVLNLKSTTYTLPPFLNEMQKLKILNVTNYGLHITEFKNFHLLGCLSNLTRIRLVEIEISSFTRPTLSLLNLQKVSFVGCKMENAFEDIGTNSLNVWPRLVEIEMEGCIGLKEYPAILCTSVYLKKLSIRWGWGLHELSEDLGKLTSLETLILGGCFCLKKLPESITKLQNLSILDISDCLQLRQLPVMLGSSSSIGTIYTSIFSGVQPQCVGYLSNTKVMEVQSKMKWNTQSSIRL